jgi:triosephosphate isomerase
MSRQIYAIGNWKMNGTSADLPVIQEIAQAAEGASGGVALCLPATLILAARGAMRLGGQDCHAKDAGAHTGDISAPMLADAGAEMVIVGHSERRADHGETDAVVAAKAKAGWAAGLTVILCIGETEAQYRSGQTLDVLARQIAGSLPEGATPDNTIIAYEPVWAIGTGLTPGINEIAKTHAFIRSKLPTADLSILYGGSVNADNARDIFALADVDGGLVGGASLTADKFIPIIQALEAEP